jgi:BMFP domain-containing protein YqiC
MSINEAVRYQDPEVPLNEVAAARADSYSAQTTLYATHKRILALEARIVDLEAALAAHAALPAEDAHDA